MNHLREISDSPQPCTACSLAGLRLRAARPHAGARLHDPTHDRAPRPHPHPPPKSATTEVAGADPRALLGVGSVEPTAAVCWPWDSVPLLRHRHVLLKWAKTTSHDGAVSPSRRAAPSRFVTSSVGCFGPFPGLLSGCAPFYLTGGDGADWEATCRPSTAGPPRAFGQGPSSLGQAESRQEPPNLRSKLAKGSLPQGTAPLLQTPCYSIVPNTEICPQQPILMLPARPQGAGFASETRVSIALCWVSLLLEDIKPPFVF